MAKLLVVRQIDFNIVRLFKCDTDFGEAATRGAL